MDDPRNMTLEEVMEKYGPTMRLLIPPIEVAIKYGMNKYQFLKTCESMWDMRPFNPEEHKDA